MRRAGMLLIATAQGPPLLIAGVVLAGSSPGFCWAPFSDAVAMLVEEERQGRVLSVVSTGTTFGLAVAGPVVLLTAATESPGNGPGWRYAWAAFAVAAFLVALWNARLLPGEPYGRASARGETEYGTGGLGIGWFLGRRSAPLLGQAFFYGLVAAFYYTYAVDLVRQSGFGEAWGPILWSLVGAARRAGLGNDVSPHWLRHSHATHAMERKTDIALVQRTLRHSSIATTGRYLHARPDDSSALHLGL